MNLHLTINGKWTDSTAIEPSRRRDPVYLETQKRLLLIRNKEVLEEKKGSVEFYVDPAVEINWRAILQGG